MFSQSNSEKLNECLACGSENLKLTLDLGTQPLANSFKNTKEEVQEEFPLAINHCTDCYHLQLTHAVNPELLFKNYLYVSGTSNTMHDHFKWFSEHTTEMYNTMNRSAATNILDIGCNDGTQLDFYKNMGLRTFGVDPAENLFKIAADKKHTVWNTFFNIDFIKNNPILFDIIIAQNVFAHNHNPVEFLQAIRNVMDEESLFFVQTSQADMIKNNEFDTIYHEHISFYCINSMNELCKRMSLYIVDVVKCPIHGNSFVFVISKNPARARPMNIANMITMERLSGLHNESTYKKYAENCNSIVEELNVAVNQYRQPDVGFHIVGYGAAAKGMTLLNYSGIVLDYVIDDNPLKQGKFTPGSSVPIVSSDLLNELKDPILFVPLAWNFYDEIYRKIKSKRDNKYDRFLTYFPKVEIKE